MAARGSDHALKDLVVAVEHADDPLLYDRACRALGALLAAHEDAGDRWLFERERDRDLEQSP